MRNKLHILLIITINYKIYNENYIVLHSTMYFTTKRDLNIIFLKIMKLQSTFHIHISEQICI